MLFCFAAPVSATHNRAGEITYEQLSQFYYKVTITTYTKTSSPADRPELDIFWGDGTSSLLVRNSFTDNFGGPGSDIRKNIYIGTHTYPGPSVYKMYFEDPNRNSDVINIPNSVDVPFYIESELIISAFLGFNNSPVLLQAPIDEGTLGQVFIHNANAFDPDGDSLAYELIYCKGAEGLPIPGYTYPAASNFFNLNPITGDLIWDSPVGCGEFNVAFLIKEFRNGVQIGFVERDMQITILCNNPNNNTPPVIATIDDICVTAGDLITFTVTANDDDNELVFGYGFDGYNGTAGSLPPGLLITNNSSSTLTTTFGEYGVTAPAYVFINDGDQIRAPVAPVRMDSVSFFVRGLGAAFSPLNELQIYQSPDNINWTLVALFDTLPASSGSFITATLNGNTYLRFEYNNVGGGTLAIDDIKIWKFNNLITLTATGAPLTLQVSPAAFNQPVYGTGNVSGIFTWQTDCDHVRRQPYQMVFKAEDNDNYINLADLESVQITVVAPAPLNPTAVPTGNSMQIGWDQSICPQAIGYKIYRRAGFYGFIPGPCETGVPAYTGYSLIGTVTGIGTTTFLDNNNGNGLPPGSEFCYMIISYFPDGAESYASVEVCATLKKDLPVITNVSVTSTSTTTGTMYIAWSMPSDLDTAQYPSPHEYRVLRAAGLNGTSFSEVGTTFNLNDTTYNDNSLNTTDTAYTYKIDLYATVNGVLEKVGSSMTATSIYMAVSPTDEQLNLSWNLDVPWDNAIYTVYRYNGISFDSIGFSFTTSYTDTGLVNGQTYCYYVMSSGSYPGPGFTFPILNNSQEICGIPYDNVPPCALTSTDTSSFDCIAPEIVLSWTLPADSCGDDINLYNIYYSSAQQGPFLLLATINDGNATSFEYTNETSIAGCYYVTAVDTNGNESAPGSIICVDNCPYYALPNIFTPDANGYNDEFDPFPYRYVQDIDLKIYNRWGLQVFETTDPDINWNGKTDNTGEDLPDGVYYYTCIVNEVFLSGVKSRELTGFVQLLSNKGIPDKQ